MKLLDGAVGLSLVGILALMSVAGCTESSSFVPAVSSSVPEFHGPWASEYSEAFRQSTSVSEKGALADGEVTEQEISQLKEAFVTCIDGKGYEAKWETRDNYVISRAPSQDAAGKAVDECEASTIGQVVSLYYQMLRNPQKLDEDTIMASCLVKRGVVPAGYGDSDLKRDMRSIPQPSFLETDSARACYEDPLGILS